MQKYYKDFKKMRPRISYEKIYQVVGIDFSNINSIDQVQANEDTIAILNDKVKQQAKRTFPFYNTRTLNTIVGYEIMNWAPARNNDIPDNEIWVG